MKWKFSFLFFLISRHLFSDEQQLFFACSATHTANEKRSTYARAPPLFLSFSLVMLNNLIIFSLVFFSRFFSFHKERQRRELTPTRHASVLQLSIFHIQLIFSVTLSRSLSAQIVNVTCRHAFFFLQQKERNFFFFCFYFSLFFFFPYYEREEKKLTRGNKQIVQPNFNRCVLLFQLDVYTVFLSLSVIYQFNTDGGEKTTITTWVNYQFDSSMFRN